MSLDRLLCLSWDLISPDGIERICGEIKIAIVMEPVRFGSWDLGRMGGGAFREKTNHIQMSGQILLKCVLFSFVLVCKYVQLHCS